VSVVKPSRDSHGVVLLVVLFFALLLSSSIATFLSRSSVDAIIARNREKAARADALARGGVRLAQALLLEDRQREQAANTSPIDGHLDLWAQLEGLEIDAGGGATLALRIEDSGRRLNLNALFETDDTGILVPVSETEPFLIAFLEKVIDEMPIPPGERALYDARELTANLIDWVDADEVRVLGGPEDEYYQRQEPPYRAANQPLLSVDELRLVEGFDVELVEALRAYVSVYPFAPGGCGAANVGSPPRAGGPLLQRRGRPAAGQRGRGAGDPAGASGGKRRVLGGPKPRRLRADKRDRDQPDLPAADLHVGDLRGDRRGAGRGDTPERGGRGGPQRADGAPPAILARPVRGERCPS
jgi:type II secretory pathway component PulK